MLTTVNRVLVALAGVVLVALGAAVLIGALDLQRHWDFALPSAWPFDGPQDVLLGRADRRKWRGEDWWWPAVIVTLAAVVLLALWWLLAQLRRHRLREIVIDTGDGEAAALRGPALETALAAEAESLDGVDRALVVLRGRSAAPEARIALTLAPHASPDTALRRVGDEALAHARSSAGLGRLPAEVRLGVVRHRAERVD
ncbi:alkaline shock response membrane anchor protein AmaP [Streptomyces sp. ISL-11]|uniref:alkaline shock response membrane anchor protein AmaP n=1 Tax=Streptomyces sp. ISL-11 TaxID=2819174 RepID=UPI001BE8502F|nr:alkaline shock response membrane anchor protein AmaP [Streptomyces sp. ISL-11]MBT2384223.1 alkaline shock response membrane anchor protein AmaP [Streptomyces sp. ISL-11]